MSREEVLREQVENICRIVGEIQSVVSICAENMCGQKVPDALSLVERQLDDVVNMLSDLPIKTFHETPEPPKPAADVTPIRRKSEARVFADADGNGANARLLPPTPADVEPEHAQ